VKVTGIYGGGGAHAVNAEDSDLRASEEGGGEGKEDK
jgi:hypothetical protein